MIIGKMILMVIWSPEVYGVAVRNKKKLYLIVLLTDSGQFKLPVRCVTI